MLNKIARAICTFGGVGLVPKAAGTAGSLAALPLAYLVQSYFHTHPGLALFYVSIALFVLGWWASRIYLRDTGKEDPGEIVIDEVAAQCLLIACLLPTWQSYLVGFILFRLFDVLKPWPISLADRKIGGGFGVMFDDLLAALYPLLLWHVFTAFTVATGHEDWILLPLNWLGAAL